jgi:hypothetical protein
MEGSERNASAIAAGSAGVGLSQAEEMLRRVSPEGRAQARRERLAQTERRNKLLARLALVALASLATLIIVGQFASFTVAVAAAGAVLVISATVILLRSKPKRQSRGVIAKANLAELPGEVGAWLAGQRRALPAAAVRLTDALDRRLDELGPQLSRLSPAEPAAEAVRKLVATELPALVEGWRGVPPSLRAVPQANGRTPNDQLLGGLRLVDEELERMTRQLARGALDEVATQGRYLELKYRPEG